MIETSVMPLEVQTNVQDQSSPVSQDNKLHASPQRTRTLWQLLRFSLVGSMNTVVDLLVLNTLLLLFPTTNSFVLLSFNALAYTMGAVNSFFLNKYWTFGYRHSMTRSELLRFTTTTLFGIALSSSIIWLASNVLHSFLLNPTIWANVSKIFAVICTSLISYLALSFWVFVRHPKSL
jgi:putative flippase GtrA